MANHYDGLDVQPKQIIGGTVSNLQKRTAMLNLLSKWERATVNYEGEEVDRFGFSLGEQVVTGVFENASFADGDDVKAVVTPRGDGTFHAHAVVRVGDGLLWMPYNVDRGTAAHRDASLRSVKWGSAVVLVVALIISAFAGDDGMSMFGMLALAAVAVLLPITYSVYRAGLPEARYAESIFKLLGFKNSPVVTLRPFALAREVEFLGKRCGFVFRLRQALAAHGSLSKAKPAAKAAAVGR